MISRSAERHKITNNSNSNLSGFKDLRTANNRAVSSVRRASSFHGKDFVDNSSYFDNKVDDLKKTNSHQNIVLNNDCLQGTNIVFESSKEISWNDADKYFKSSSRTNTSAPQTGRPSVAKLRAQNAGMVLAKARLFDECTAKTPEFVTANTSNKKHRDPTTKRSPKTNKETQISRKQSNKDLNSKNCHAMLSPNAKIKTQLINSPSKPVQDRMDKNYRSTQKFELQNQKFSNKDPIEIVIKQKKINDARDTEVHQKENIIAKTSPLTKMSVNTMLENSTVSPYKPDVTKTPHIKRPLTVKTPRSTKIVRRPPVDTRRTPLKATAQLGTPKRQSPKSILKTRTLSTHA